MAVVGVASELLCPKSTYLGIIFRSILQIRVSRLRPITPGAISLLSGNLQGKSLGFHVTEQLIEHLVTQFQRVTAYF
jgi:hypothetical protein